MGTDPVSISGLTQDQMEQMSYDKARKANRTLDLVADTKYALCLLKLAPGVTVPDDYPALKLAIEAVTGVVEIDLVFDYQTEVTVPVERELKAQIRADITRPLIPIPEPSPSPAP